MSGAICGGDGCNGCVGCEALGAEGADVQNAVVAVEHTEGGTCWCQTADKREVALDRLVPDRCGQPIIPAGSRVQVASSCVAKFGHVGTCRGGLESLGGPCHFCGRNYREDACPSCWQTLEGMPFADIRAEFAAYGGQLSIDPDLIREVRSNG